MSIVKTLLALSLFTLVTACAQQEEPVMVEDPIIDEPVSEKF